MDDKRMLIIPVMVYLLLMIWIIVFKLGWIHHIDACISVDLIPFK